MISGNYVRENIYLEGLSKHLVKVVMRLAEQRAWSQKNTTMEPGIHILY